MVYGKCLENGFMILSSRKTVAVGPKTSKWKSCSQGTLYAMGHMQNDMVASMWFSYFLLFFQQVLEMTPIEAAMLLFLGQVTDAFATPITGVCISSCCDMAAWYLLGCVMIATTFPLIFLRCYICEVFEYTESYHVWELIYYAVIIELFQISWAIVQITHLAMLPLISKNDPGIREEFTSYRYLDSIVASMTVYITTWLVLQSSDDEREPNEPISPDDDYKFSEIVVALSLIGIASFLLSYLLFGRKYLTKAHPINEPETTTDSGRKPLKLIDFFKMPLLYQTVLIYVSSRLFVSLSLIYLPLFLEERLVNRATGGIELIATIPWTLYISSFLSTMILKYTIHRCGSRISFLFGSILCLSSCAWIYFVIDSKANVMHIYLVSLLIGAGSAITSVTSLVIAGELIGAHSHQAAAVFSIVTFADKLITGITVLVIEFFNCDTCTLYYRSVLIYACGISAVIGIGAIFTFYVTRNTRALAPVAQINK